MIMMFHKIHTCEVIYLRILTHVHAASFKKHIFIKLTLFVDLGK